MLEPDRAQLQLYIDAVFRHVDPRGHVSLRAFEEGTNKPLRTAAPSLVGGLGFLAESAEDFARRAANNHPAAVFCPSPATFTNGEKAREQDLFEGPVLSVECDAHPAEARATLERLFGPATLIIRSGGFWFNGDGVAEDKLHLYWRLNRPACGPELKELKTARELAARLVGADPASAPVCHPMRWPGSWHLKGEPRLCLILHMNPDREISLEDALRALEAAPQPSPASGDPPKPGADPTSWVIDYSDHAQLTAFAMRLMRAGMHDAAVVNFLRDHVEALPDADPDRKARRLREIPAMVSSARKKLGEKTRAPTGVRLFDPWEQFFLPNFPFAVLPRVARVFIERHTEAIGVDPSAMAMATLAAISGAISHRFKMRMTHSCSWWESPRLWALLVGDPAKRKTPTITAATRALRAYEAPFMAHFRAELRDCLRRKKAKEKDVEEPDPPPRWIVNDTTIEKLGEIMARNDKGVLVVRDELSGWIGDMDRYGGAGKKASSDRGFWLQAHDGGPWNVDRIGRGEIHIPNLSASILGGLQLDRLRELEGLISDGMLQRFAVVMMSAANVQQDVNTQAVDEDYFDLIAQLARTDPRTLTFTEAAQGEMMELLAHLHALEQAAGRISKGFQGFVGKLGSLVGRITLILRVIEDLDYTGYEVFPNSLRDARAVVLDFLLPHAREFYRAGEAVTDMDQLRKIASYVLTCKQATIEAREFVQKVRCLRGVGVNDLGKHLSPLVAGGWLEPMDPGPSNRLWTVAPAVQAQFERRRQIEEADKRATAELYGSPRRPVD